MSRLLLAAVLLAACVPPDPPVRAMMEIPAAPPRDLPFQTERQALDAVRGVLVAGGLPKAEILQAQINTRIVLPLASGDAVFLGRFLVDPSAARAVLAAASQQLTGVPLPLSGLSDAELADRSLALQLASLAVAFGHGSATANKAHDRDNAWLDRQRALDLAWPLLHALADQSRLAPSVVAAWPRLLQALLDSLPAEVRAHMPTDPAQVEAAYNAAAAHAQPDAAPSGTDAQIAAGLALRHALAATQSPPVPLLGLSDAFNPDPHATLQAVARGMETPDLLARKVQWKVVDNHVVGWFEGTALEFGLDVDEGKHTVEGWLWQALVVPPVREPDVLRLVNLANLEHGPTRMELQKDRLVLYAPAREADLNTSAAMLGDLLAQSDLWFGPVARVARGELTLDAAKQAVVRPAPKEGN